MIHAFHIWIEFWIFRLFGVIDHAGTRIVLMNCYMLLILYKSTKGIHL